MDGKIKDKLNKIVNSSGFPLQIGLQNKVNKTFESHGWKVFTNEHPWQNIETGNSGFIDLTLIDQCNVQVSVIECKRVQDSDWLFLIPSSNPSNRRHAKYWRTQIENNKTIYFDWRDSAVDPSSPESEFCVVLGHDRKSKPMLERIASELIDATESMASEEYQLHINKKLDLFRIYYPVIVTTAKLQVCKFNPEDISIDNGKIDKVNFETVPFVRFRKSLVIRNASTTVFNNLKDVVRAKERTIFVVNASHVLKFLETLEIVDHR